MWAEWSVHGYFARYNHMSLDTSPDLREYALMRDSNCASVDMASYERVELDTRTFHLYRKVGR
jgi:hypothetical protein